MCGWIPKQLQEGVYLINLMQTEAPPPFKGAVALVLALQLGEIALHASVSRKCMQDWTGKWLQKEKVQKHSLLPQPFPSSALYSLPFT